MEKIKSIVNKLFSKEVILYVVFGILITFVNLASFYILNTIFKIDENISNIIAIILAVLTAYFTNKDLVFHSKAKTIQDKCKEFFKFITGRIFTMIIEFLGGVLLFQTPIPNIISKCIITIVVVILNFFISKYFAFKKKNNN